MSRTYPCPNPSARYPGNALRLWCHGEDPKHDSCLKNFVRTDVEGQVGTVQKGDDNDALVTVKHSLHEGHLLSCWMCGLTSCLCQGAAVPPAQLLLPAELICCNGKRLMVTSWSVVLPLPLPRQLLSNTKLT